MASAESGVAEPLPVTILVPTFNRVGYLPQALDSLLSQTRPAAEVIVIDDGSEDGTPGVVKAYGDKVRYLRQANSGKSAALNNGLSHARGDYVWIFDDDDVAEPDALATLYDALHRRPDAGFAYGLCDRFYGAWPSAVSAPNTSYQSGDRKALYVRLLEDFFMWQGAMLVRRSAYQAVGPFDVRMARSQDYEMNLRLTRAFAGVGVPRVIFHQRHHDGVRGPKAATVKAGAVEAAWRKYNQIIFDEIYASHDLSEFQLGPDSAASSDRGAVSALLQRGCIMARRGLWPKALKDFETAADLCNKAAIGQLNDQETAALRRVFQSGARSTLSGPGDARALRRAVARFKAPGHAGAISGNLLLPVSHRLKKRLTDRDAPAGELGQLFLIASALWGPSAASQYLQARRAALPMYGVAPLVDAAAAGA